MKNSIDELFEAALNGDEKKAEHIGNGLKSSLSEDKKQILEKALSDREYLKSILSTDKAKNIMEELNKRGIK